MSFLNFQFTYCEVIRLKTFSTMSEDVFCLYSIPWEVPECSAPTSPVVFNVSIAVSRCVLKKQSAVKIPRNFSKQHPIVVETKSMADYHSFSSTIKSSCPSLKITSNVIFFADFENEQRFLYDINCIWALTMNKSEVSILIVTLNNDLTSRLVGWDIVSPVIKEDLNPPPTPSEKMQSIESMQATCAVERRQRSVEILSEEESMNFAGPIYKRNESESFCKVTIWKRYSTLLLSLNSLMYTIDHQFLDIGRTIPLDEKIVTDICIKVLEEHSLKEDD